MKISKTQAGILEKSKNVIKILREYKNFADFFDNCPYGRQNTYTTAASCNGAYDSSEKYKAKDPERWAEMEKQYNEVINEQIIIVFAKTESLAALERAGLIKVVKAAIVKGGAEKIKIL